MRKIIAVLLSLLLIFSSIASFPMQTYAQNNPLSDEYYSNPNNLLGLLPETNTYEPIMNPMLGISTPLPNTSPEIPNNQIAPRSLQQEPPLNLQLMSKQVTWN